MNNKKGKDKKAFIVFSSQMPLIVINKVEQIFFFLLIFFIYM